MKAFRDLSPLERRSFDLWLAKEAERRPDVALRRSAEIRPEGEATVVPLAGSDGARYEVLVWPDGSVNGMRELA